MITRQDAISQGLPRYFTGQPCKHGHIAERYTGNKTCCVCANAASSNVKKRNPKKYLALVNKWKKQNPLNVKQSNLKANRANPAKRNLWTANYRSAKDNRTPAWLTDFDKLKIECMYSIASMLTRENKEPWHIDHIIPLRGENVSGLHIPSNLQFIRGIDNVRKSNQYGS